MKGKLIYDQEGWWVQHTATSPDGTEYFQTDTMLHPDDVKFLEDCNLVFDNLEARIAAYPEVEFELIDTATGITLKNLTDGGREFVFSTLNTTETVYVNNQRKQIISDTNLYRYSKFNKNWFRLVYGINQIRVTGKCILKVRSQFPIII